MPPYNCQNGSKGAFGTDYVEETMHTKHTRYMGHDKHKHDYSAPETEETELTNNEAEEMQEEAEECETNHKAETCKKLLQEAKEKIADLEDKNLRMMAEFDNYRRRTNKEKLELIETAGERIFTDMLPLLDDMERAMKAMEKSDDVESLKEGMQLIYQKFLSFLEKNEVKQIETKDKEFSTDEHEAVTTFAAGEDKKGKIIDCTQTGYKLGEKVIRFAKVVVGE